MASKSQTKTDSTSLCKGLDLGATQQKIQFTELSE